MSRLPIKSVLRNGGQSVDWKTQTFNATVFAGALSCVSHYLCATIWSAFTGGTSLDGLPIGLFFAAANGGATAFFFGLPCMAIVVSIHRLLGRPLRPWYQASLIAGLTMVMSVSTVWIEPLWRKDGLNLDLMLDCLTAILFGQVIVGWWLATARRSRLRWLRGLRSVDVDASQRNVIQPLEQPSFWRWFARREIRTTFNLLSLFAVTTAAGLVSGFCHLTETPPMRLVAPIVVLAFSQIVMIPLLWILIQAKNRVWP